MQCVEKICENVLTYKHSIIDETISTLLKWKLK